VAAERGLTHLAITDSRSHRRRPCGTRRAPGVDVSSWPGGAHHDRRSDRAVRREADPPGLARPRRGHYREQGGSRASPIRSIASLRRGRRRWEEELATVRAARLRRDVERALDRWAMATARRPSSPNERAAGVAVRRPHPDGSWRLPTRSSRAARHRATARAAPGATSSCHGQGRDSSVLAMP
jgi:hypothetical protein